MDDIDIWRSANLLVEMHGAEDAQLVSARRADAYRQQGDMEGFIVWTRIVLAIMTLDRRKPREGD